MTPGHSDDEPRQVVPQQPIPNVGQQKAWSPTRNQILHTQFWSPKTRYR